MIKSEIKKVNILGYDVYSISTDGVLLGRTGKQIKKWLCKNGYYYYSLSVNSNRINLPIHRILALTFIPNPEKKREVNHINGIKTDNRIDNLEWCTTSENSKHAFKLGLKFTSEKTRAACRINGKLGRKIVLNTETGIYYDSIILAAKSTRYKRSTVNLMLTNKSKNKTNLILV